MEKAIRYTVTEDDVKRFAELSGDFNPLHTKEGVVHGMFLGALVSRLIGMELPGPGALMIKETLEFRKPAYVGDTVVVRGRITHESKSARLVELAIEISRDKELLVSGSAHIRI